jgi:light-regulated signal transduction histidine kinase (bacteriophytochrome)
MKSTAMRISTNDNIINMQPDTVAMTGPDELDACRKELADITREMNQFAYIVSHDLQAPLRMVTGFIDLLVKKYDSQLDEQGRMYIGYAAKGADKMKRLIFDLLDYSRLNTVEEDFVLTDFGEIVKETLEKMEPTLSAAGVAVAVGDLPCLSVKRKQALLLTAQLLDNAIKFRCQDQPRIRIHARKEADYWKIGFTDNGIGIDPAYQEKIFVIFRRLYADEEKYRGTGIGLALCKKICEIHHGNIQVESEPGKGSTFWVILPEPNR